MVLFSMDTFGSIKKCLISLLVIALMSSTGCSGIVRAKAYVPENLPEGWGLCKSYAKFCYKFSLGNVSILLENYSDQQRVITHLGPPFIPLFPYTPSPYPGFAKGIYFHLTIESQRDSVALDLEQAKVMFPDSRTVLPSVEVAKEFYEDYPAVVKKYESIPLQKVIVSNGVMKYLVAYSWPDSEPEEFTVEIGALQINDRDVNLPLLTFRKVARHEYKALGLSNQ